MNSRILVALLIFSCTSAWGDEAALKDPTTPFNRAHTPAAIGAPLVTKKSGPRWILDGVLISDEGKKALLNGRWYKEHEFVNGWQVLTVEASSVVLARDGKVQHIPLYPSLRKNTVNPKPE